jgi:hypothetical protein
MCEKAEDQKYHTNCPSVKAKNFHVTHNHVNENSIHIISSSTFYVQQNHRSNADNPHNSFIVFVFLNFEMIIISVGGVDHNIRFVSNISNRIATTTYHNIPTTTK